MGLHFSTSPGRAGVLAADPLLKDSPVPLSLLPRVKPLVFIMSLSSDSGLPIYLFNLYLLSAQTKYCAVGLEKQTKTN